jgi:hypothetical protein
MTLPGFESSTTLDPLEFRVQIVVEVAPQADDAAPREASARGADDNAKRLAESARFLLQQLSGGADVRTASLTWPGGVRLVAQGSARSEDLDQIRAVAAALVKNPTG